MPSLWWKGLMSGYDQRTRRVLLVLLWVFSMALSFTQLGFVGIGFPGEYWGYMVVLLMPITLSAVLLGTRSSVCTGLFAGTVALLHANLMPLDYYEFTFVNVYSSVVAMTLTGFLLGVLLARALRRECPTWRKHLRIAVVCTGVSLVYAVGFGGNMLASAVAYMMRVIPMTELNAILADVSASTSLQTRILMILSQAGDLLVQWGLNALNMTVCACLAMLAVDRLGQPDAKRTIRFTFNSALMVVAAIAFCVTATLCYVGISTVEFMRGTFLARDSLKYIANQLNAEQKKADVVDAILSEFATDDSGNPVDLGDSRLRELTTTFSAQSVLEGYDPELDGYVFVGSIDNNYAYLSDVELDESEHGGHVTPLDELLNAEVIDAARRSKDSGLVVKTVYDYAYRDIVRSIKASEDTAQGFKDSLAKVNQWINQDGGATSELMYVLTIENNQSGDDLVLMVSADYIYPTRNLTMLAVSLTFGTLMTLVLVMVSKLSDGIIVGRICAINDTLGDIEGGDLSIRADVRDTVEFDELSNHVNTAVDSLEGLIDQAKRQNKVEMAAAKAIQESAIPQTFPPYPDNDHFDIYASMQTAKAVGGDFYDFFMIGDPDGGSGKLAFLMADVSGKGIPASLFMMKADTQLRDYLTSGMEIGEAITNANYQLCENNETNMFVTAWVGILDYMTGHIDYVNAGHNPPMMLCRETGEWSWLRENSGVPLGMFDDETYESFELECSPGDKVFLYTDGVTESFSATMEQFGEGRLEALLGEHLTEHPRELIDLVRHAVEEHARGAEQFDDITMLALEFGVPPESTDSLCVSAEISELANVHEFIHGELSSRLCPIRVQRQIAVAVEEIFTNICDYAYDGDGGKVLVKYAYNTNPSRVVISLSDSGIPYNPLEAPDMPKPKGIDDVSVNGLGIVLAKHSVDEMRYERTDGRNVLTLSMHW